MRRGLFILAVGIIIGLLVQTYKQPKNEVSAQNLEAKVIDTHSSPPQPSNLKKEQTNSPSEATRPAPTVTRRKDRDIQEQNETHGLIINEENVQEMEKQGNQLARYAFTTQTTEGWKIQISPDDKVFLNAGLRSGDLITFQSMNSQLQNPERASLAARMVAILNQIQQ